MTSRRVDQAIMQQHLASAIQSSGLMSGHIITRSGLSPQSILNLRRSAHAGSPHLLSLVQLARGLGVSLSALFPPVEPAPLATWTPPHPDRPVQFPDDWRGPKLRAMVGARWQEICAAGRLDEMALAVLGNTDDPFGEEFQSLFNLLSRGKRTGGLPQSATAWRVLCHIRADPAWLTQDLPED